MIQIWVNFCTVVHRYVSSRMIRFFHDIFCGKKYFLFINSGEYSLKNHPSKFQVETPIFVKWSHEILYKSLPKKTKQQIFHMNYINSSFLKNGSTDWHEICWKNGNCELLQMQWIRSFYVEYKGPPIYTKEGCTIFFPKVVCGIK